MRSIIIAATLALTSLTAHANSCPDVLKFVKRKLNAQETVNLCQAYAGKTLLVVNTASFCGFTPQFEGLEALYDQYRDQDFAVLGFPSHDFNQEADSEAKTAELCELTYGVEFPMFEPTSVSGDDIDPMFRMLRDKSGVEVKWNFYKYLLNAKGEVVKAFPSKVKPSDSEFVEVLETTLGS